MTGMRVVRAAARRCPPRRQGCRVAIFAALAGPESHQDVMDDLELGDGAKHNWGARWATDTAGAWWALPEPAVPVGGVPREAADR
jgi:hypothetical protein